MSARAVQLALALPPRPPACDTCGDLGAIAVRIRLPSGQPSFRLDPCPDCAEERDLDPR